MDLRFAVGGSAGPFVVHGVGERRHDAQGNGEQGEVPEEGQETHGEILARKAWAGVQGDAAMSRIPINSALVCNVM